MQRPEDLGADPIGIFSEGGVRAHSREKEGDVVPNLETTSPIKCQTVNSGCHGFCVVVVFRWTLHDSDQVLTGRMFDSLDGISLWLIPKDLALMANHAVHRFCLLG